MMKVFIETYGCQMNVADSELVASILHENNFLIVEDIDSADVIIFNTCSVRQHAEDRVLGRISNEAARKNENRELKIGVIGCMAQRLGENLQYDNSKIDFVVGVDQYHKLPEIITNLFVNPGFSYDTAVNNREIYENLYPIHSGQFNAFVTIMRGCNNFCSYCIVPYTRGRERSRSAEEILQEVSAVGKMGFKDVTLLGQNVNSYKYENTDFAGLLRKVNAIPDIERIRFVTSHPKDLSDSVIAAMAESKKVCEHLHLALQSGDDEVLRRMNRGYTADHYRSIVHKLRGAMPGIAITTDIIAGFPGETEEQFQRTYALMKEIEFDYAFTFKYSPRTGTKAAEYTDQIPEEVRLERLQQLIDLQQDITLKKYREQIGKVKEIYVERISKKSADELAGKSRDFKITVFPGNPDLIGKFVKVRIIDATGWTLKGEMVN
ncbi:MAG TPA: tRNA (N6-isopentenyl adenosine(37)-C2)-methylthiotransferase MiaB [Candidatus Cloacimonadota bacterium]|nr:tRNA (N6-isopentenyl adenosine(37)-C2)-methylthiotransferase MiaB [Candidatus Cloacimonadota bacterium]